MPQRDVPGHPQTEGDVRAFKHMLSHADLLYLGASVLVLLDRSYMSRFWTQFEAWLAAREVRGKRGLDNARSGHARWTIALLYGCPPQSAAALVHEWARVTPDEAHAKLSKPDVSVTNQSDKVEQLNKLRKLVATINAVSYTHLTLPTICSV